jgi:hypothetical protein
MRMRTHLHQQRQVAGRQAMELQVVGRQAMERQAEE